MVPGRSECTDFGIKRQFQPGFCLPGAARPPLLKIRKVSIFITATAKCGAVKDGKTDCGWAKARFEGPGAQLVKLTRDGNEDSKRKTG